MPDVSPTMMLVPSEIHFDLRNMEHGDYDRAIEYCIEGLACLPGVYFIGQFGSIQCPGVSDVDLLIVAGDSEFKAVYKKCRQICGNAPNGGYLFAHPPTVIPHCLAGVCRVLHSLKGLRMLWGDSTVLGILKEPPFEVRVVNGIIWNSHMWQAAVHMNLQKSLRGLLLMHRNFVQSVAADYEVIGEIGRRDSILSWGNEIRNVIVGSDAEKQRELIMKYFEEVLCRWIEADWELHDWWLRSVESKPWSKEEVQIRLSPRVVASGSQRRQYDKKSIGDWHELMNVMCREVDGLSIMTIPSYYVDIIRAVRSPFDDWLNFQDFEVEGGIMGRDGSDGSVWGEASQVYREAVRSVRRFAREKRMDELEMYQQISCLPFGLCLRRHHRRKSGLESIKATADRIVRSLMKSVG